MIDVSNLKDTLKTLGFIAYGDIYEKAFSEIGCSLKVDFQAKRLIYPNEIKGRERNDSFDQKENFVVFECVCRLLSKGYRPEHIELEKEWHLGHDAKGGRADICVSDTSGNMLFIIECKTWGREYDKALNNTKSDGAQLFSYWQQEHSCKWLVLYASDLRSGCIAYKAPTIDCSDDANIILLSKKDKSIKLYRDAHTTSAKYEAWKETYGSQIHDDLIFSEDSVAYQIGVKPLRKKDLRDFTPDDKIVNKFEEILRHNNVSDKENAFNRLVALFRQRIAAAQENNNNGIVVYPNKHPYEELDQVGYWCLINVLNAKDFREFLGNSAAFDFYCEYTKFDFNKFDVPWLLNLYPHTLEQIAKNEKVKGCVRVAIANALNDGEIALSDSQRLQSILIKHFC